ncbi:MAG: globin domain-containing protein [Amaricoccus sp.]|uniref:globin domain-containing protein n=1 Tax=Amaricoccus sp. TaxID=1872485 RepID=UPI0039E6528C
MLDDRQRQLVAESLTLVRASLLPASSQFYDNLFALAPELRRMFRTDLAGQGMRFMTTLTMVAELLDEPEELGREIDGLAQAHRGIGVRTEHFAPVGSALLVTLGETLGPAFTCELREAWRAAYDAFAARMIESGGFS